MLSVGVFSIAGRGRILRLRHLNDAIGSPQASPEGYCILRRGTPGAALRPSGAPARSLGEGVACPRIPAFETMNQRKSRAANPRLQTPRGLFRFGFRPQTLNGRPAPFF